MVTFQLLTSHAWLPNGAVQNISISIIVTFILVNVTLENKEIRRNSKGDKGRQVSAEKENEVPDNVGISYGK